jgi:tol-pal system protein YbgF
VVQVEQLQAQIRQLTGQIEQLRYRNQQLETQLQRLGGVPAGQPLTQAPQPLPPQQSATLPRQSVQQTPLPPPQHQQQQQAVQPPPQAQVVAEPTLRPPGSIPGHRSDAFDPTQNPNAPGAPRTLGTVPAPASSPPPVIMAEPQPGAPRPRTPGEPLDLSTLATGIPNTGTVPPNQPMAGNSPLPPPPSRSVSATGVAPPVSPATETAKGYYDLAYGYVLRRDYALAEDTFQLFLKKYPSDKLAPDAQYWLGESMFQRQKYEPAASAFLDISTKNANHPKAAEALLRLGQSLAALNQKDMACATLAEVKRKYPRSPANVRQGAEQEQKRAGC